MTEKTKSSCLDQENGVCVVGGGYCLPHLVDLVVKRRMVGPSHVHNDVFDDEQQNLLLQVDGKLWELQRERFMSDTAGLPILSMRNKGILTCRDVWEFYKEDRADESSLLFTMKQTHLFQLKSEFDIYLATTETKDLCDFKVIGCYTNQSFKVYKRDKLVAEGKRRGRLYIEEHKDIFSENLSCCGLRLCCVFTNNT